MARSRPSPSVTWSRVQHQLAVALGVRRIKLVIGGSLGGMQVLEWALLYPELVEAQVFIASTARHSAWAIGLGEAQRQAIFADPRWRGGDYDEAEPPEAGLAAARMTAMLSYRSFPSFEERFGRRAQSADQFAIESYLHHQGRALVDRFDPASYVTLTRAMDTHDVSRGRGDFDEVLRGVRAQTLVVAIDSDILYWPAEQREVARLVPGARLAVMDSPHGHDAFLIDVDRLSDLVAEFRGRTALAAGGDTVERAYAGKGLSLLVMGKGKVGGALLDQLAALRGSLEADHDLVLRLAGVADARHPLRRARRGPGDLAGSAGRRPGDRAHRRRPRSGAARPAGAAARPGADRPDRRRRDGGGLPAGLPARHRRHHRQQAAAGGAVEAGPRAARGPPAGPPDLRL